MESYTLKGTVEYAIKEYGKNISDIKYVSYYIGNYLQTRQQFYCSYEDFINTFGDKIMYNLNWYWDIKFVGDDWWLVFDSRGDWIMHIVPVKPSKYRKPEEHLLTIKVKSYSDESSNDEKADN